MFATALTIRIDQVNKRAGIKSKSVGKKIVCIIQRVFQDDCGKPTENANNHTQYQNKLTVTDMSQTPCENFSG